MDVSLSVRFTAAERWEKGAARRVLIDSDLWSEPSLAEAASDSYVGAMGELVRLPPRCSASCRPNRHAMANGPLPELLRDLGIETLLDDPETLHRMAEVALDRAGLAANGRAPEEYRLEVELFEWCTMRLALLAAEDSVLHAAAPSTSRH